MRIPESHNEEKQKIRIAATYTSRKNRKVRKALEDERYCG